MNLFAGAERGLVQWGGRVGWLVGWGVDKIVKIRLSRVGREMEDGGLGYYLGRVRRWVSMGGLLVVRRMDGAG